MIQISDNLYINKYQILDIKVYSNEIQIHMVTDKYYYIDRSDYEYYRNIKILLEGNNE